MKTVSTDNQRAVGLLYVAAAFVLALELTEVAVLAYPAHPEVASWRYGVIGTLAGKAATFALADLMVLAAALYLEHRGLVRVLGILHLVLAIAMLPIVSMYGLDMLTLRRAIRPQFVRSFDLNSLRTIGICLLSLVVGVMVYWRTRGIRASRDARTPQRAVLMTDLPQGGR